MLFTIFILSLVSFPSTAVIEPSVNPPISVRKPEDELLQPELHRNLLWLIKNMESADFTPDNVYYGVYNNVGSYSYRIVGSGIQNIPVNLTRLIDLLNKTVERLETDNLDGTFDDDSSLDYLRALLTELKAHNTIEIQYKVESNLMVKSFQDKKAVSIFYDRDRSVLDAFDMISENQSV
ncbi:MAG: hypothetical protein ACTSQH_00345, partial [Candidatus Hodarchaeales archaeon]